jgi:sugar fermentation stimulation protein A
MKFKKPLTEAILLKRSFRFLVEVILASRKRRMVYCPNLGPLLNCDVLGSRIWFSAANRLSQGYLEVLELTEINGGELVAVNPDYAQVLVREGLSQEMIPELKEYRFLHGNVVPQTNNIELLLKENGEQCFIHIEPVFFGDDRGEGYFPETLHQSVSQVQELITQKELGNRAVLFYCIQNTGIRCLRLADAIHPPYGRALRAAALAGVEVLAYRTNISLQEITLESRIPVLLSENLTYR